MQLQDHYYVNNEKIFFIYDLSSDSWINDLEKKIFCNKSKTSYIIHYKLLSDDEKRLLNIPIARKDVCLLPFHQTGVLYDFLSKDSNYLKCLKRHKNSNEYFKKWIYQIVNAVYDIHMIKGMYHGFLSDICIFIDEKLNSQIGFIGVYDLDSSDPYQKNFIKYFDSSRSDIFQKCDNNFTKYLEQEKENQKSIKYFQNYDIYALGVLLKNILDVMKNGSKDTDNDQVFKNTVENDIIKQCLQPSTERPDIKFIKEKLDELISQNSNSADNITDTDKTSSEFKLSDLKMYNAANLIAYKIETNPSLLKYLHTSTDLTRIKYMLHDNYKFQILYNFEEDCFLTKPTLINKTGLKFSKENFNDQLKQQMENDNLYNMFYSNIYFCSLRELLKMHKPSYLEIHYWALNLANQIASYHSGDFLTDPVKYEQNSSETRLPCNFSSETIFVSFINYENCAQSKSFSNPLQFQLSIFPFDAKQTKLSQIYQSNKLQEKRTRKEDFYSFGVLLLELLSTADTGKSCFNGIRDDDDDDDDNLKNLSFNALRDLHLPEEQKFYADIVEKCINTEIDDIFQIQSLLIFQGKNPENDDCFPEDPEIMGDDDESLLLDIYIKQNSEMNKKRFTNLFKCYEDISEDELSLKNIYCNALNELNQDFFNKRPFKLNQEIAFFNLHKLLESNE